MRFRGTLLLLIAALVIGAFYFLSFLPQQREREMMDELSVRFFRVNPESVEFLRIRNPRGTYTIEKHDNIWNLTTPAVLPTDGQTMQRILHLITGGRIIKVISHDLSRAGEFGLANPHTVLSIGYGGKIDELMLGGSNPAGTGIYAFAGGINAVFIVDNETTVLTTVGLYELRAKEIFRFDPDKVTGIRIVRNNGEIVLVRNHAWQMLQPVSGRAGRDDIRDFLLSVLNQRAATFHDDLKSAQDRSGDSIQLILSYPDRTQTVIDVRYLGTGVDAGALAHQQGMPYAGRLSRDFWNLLSADAARFKYRDLLDFEESQAGKIRVNRGPLSYELQRKGDVWYVNDRPADRKKVTEFLWFLRSWKAERLLSPALSFARDDPSAWIILQNMEGNPIGSVTVYGKLKDGSLGFFEGEEQFLHYAESSNLENACAISSLDLRKIPDVKDLTP